MSVRKQILYAIAVVCVATAATAQTPDSQRLDAINSAADRICNVIKNEDTSEGAKVTGKIEAEVSGLAKQLVDLSGNVQGQYNTESYVGVLQCDLPNVLKNNADCKLQVFHKLSDLMLNKEAGKGGDSSDNGGAGGEQLAGAPGVTPPAQEAQEVVARPWVVAEAEAEKALEAEPEG
jgi:hypothetical protein